MGKNEFDWDKPDAIPVKCGGCRTIGAGRVRVVYTDYNGDESDEESLCSACLDKLKRHKNKHGGNITYY